MAEPSNRSFPDPLAPDSEKKTDAYGLRVAHAIAGEWFKGTSIGEGTDFHTRREWVRKMRLSSRGKDGIDSNKDRIAVDKDQLDFMNMDWRNVNLLGKFVNIAVNSVKEEHYHVDVSATDKLSNSIRDRYRKELEANMYGFKMLQKARQIQGIDLLPRGFVPEDEEELDIHMDLDYKPTTEIVEELLIDYVKKSNNWHNIKQKCNYDFVESGLGGVRCYTDKTEGVAVRYVDIENLVHSFVTMNDFSDDHYYSEVDTITIGELQRKSGFSERQLRDIAEKYAGAQESKQKGMMWGYNYESGDIDRILGYKVNVQYFTFKTAKKIVYKKSKGKYSNFKMKKKDESFEQKQGDYERVDTTLDTWYEGTHVIGTDYIYEYKESENLVEDELNRARSCFIVRATDIYQNQLHSFVEDCLPIKDQMQRVHLKVQQLIAEMRPDPIELDLDMLAELDSGVKGKQNNWKQALALFNAKGVYFSTRANLGEDGMKDRPAVRHAPSQQASQLPALLNSWAHYYNLLRDITGINPFADGSQPSDALVGVTEMAQMSMNTATEYIVKASMDLSRTVAERISSRLSDIHKYSNIKNIYTRVVGKKNLGYLDTVRDRHLHEFGFTVSMVPTRQDLQEFKVSLDIALGEQSIDVEDKIQAEAIAKRNIKQALMYLTYRRKKNLKRKRKEELENIKVQSQANAEAAERAEMAKMQVYGEMAKVDIQKEQNMSMIRIKELQATNQINDPEKRKEWQFELYKEQLRASTSMQEKQFVENQKTYRQDRNNAQASKMIDQRTKDTPPIDFENDISVQDAVSAIG